MISHYAFDTLGKADHGWLKAKHHFSFADYYNSARMGFGTLRVINDDMIAPDSGFPTHSHSNMEIVTFVRSGTLNHKDSVGNEGVIRDGEVQVMSAGFGIAHSEYNLSNEPLVLYQIWIETNKHNVEPRWDSKLFSSKNNNTELPLLVSGYPEDEGKTLFINQLARIYGGKLKQGVKYRQNIDHQMYILLSSGSITVSDDAGTIVMNKGDGAEITKQKSMEIEVLENSEIILIDTPNQ